MKKFILLGAVALLLGFSIDTSAQRRYRNYGGVRVNDRADRQRVRRGIRSGQITRDEARLLRERQRQIRAERRGYRSDGTLTREERHEIRRDEREHDRQIREYRRNEDRRDRRRGNGYYRRGAGSPSHPVFGNGNRRRY
ncbi:MAG TPA: hypothetical protein VM934_06935 [Pyrinomonadaceae bacterium]|jgi:hypothetical protein|nr:hypothetical protein [Pyrinomonadaceae bacterium]